MKNRLLPMLLILSIFIPALTGCIDDDDDEDSVPSTIHAPVWEPGKFWIYVFSTPDEMDIATRMVVAPDDGTNHLVGAADPNDARLHGVLNYNPLLGRIRMEDFGVYEKGVPQPLFTFPMKKGTTWNFSFLDVDGWEAKVESIKKADIPASGKTIIVGIHAEAPGGEVMDYSFDTSAGWVHLMRARDSQGNPMVNMTLVSHGSGYSGEVYFIRGRDLYDEDYSSTPASPLVDVYDTFLDEGHPKYGDFDRLIIYLNVRTKENSGGSLTLRDHESTAAYHFVITPERNGNHIDDIPDESGNWTLVVNLDGNSYLRIRVAGGIWDTWEV